MRTTIPTAKFRQFLDDSGLDHITSKRELFEHIAASCVSHDDFRKLIDKCPPERRARIFDLMTPHLKFPARPLDVYVAENQNEAERRQLPTIGDVGALKPFRPGSIASAEYIAQQAFDLALCEFHLVVKCYKCLKTAEFHGMRKIDAVAEARDAGWVYDLVGEQGREICPECPGGK